jgi:hypothetical protein
LAGNFEKIESPDLRLQSVKNHETESGGWFAGYRVSAKIS